MDGIFGVGIGEMAVIAIVLLVVGGPRNTVKWAREAGRMVRQAREYIGLLMADFEKEMGEDGQEIVRTVHQLRSGVQDVKQASSPVRLAQQADKFIKDAVDTNKLQSGVAKNPPTMQQSDRSQPANDALAAWTPIKTTATDQTTESEDA